jgi:uncharacterized repeat protein (TIGR01451 family)
VDAGFTTNGTTPVHVSALMGQRILILVSVDTGSDARDWGYVPVDSRYFATSYFIPYAPSGKRASEDMQLLVTPVYDGTTIYVDYDQDGVIDDNVTLNRLESWGFYDPDDMDNTGTHLFSDFDFTVVYGETRYADAGQTLAGYDWGYTLIPLDYLHYITALNITKTVFPPVVPYRSLVTFTLTVKSGNYTISDVDVYDILPVNCTYVQGSTTITHTDGTISHLDPTVSGQVITWDLDEEMEPYEILTVVFDSNASACAGFTYRDIAVANGTDPWGNFITPEAYGFVTVSCAGMVVGTLEDVTDPTPAPVPGVTVTLRNCTDGTVYALDVTDGNGLYSFIDLRGGLYCVFYNTSDPDLGSLLPKSDDDPTEPEVDPLSSSANFTLPENGYHRHDFQVALPVDLAIEKTGPATAFLGDKVAYNYTVTNEGLTDASYVEVVDDVCGNATYVSGDLDLDGELDPGESWLFQCTHTVDVLDPDPLVNTANVTTSDMDIDPSDDQDDWSVDLIRRRMDVDKTLTDPPGGVADINDTIVFTVTVANLGDTPLYTVPLNDTYDPSKLDYLSADPSPDSIDEGLGALLWNDLTGPGDLSPGENVTIAINFTAVGATEPGSTTNRGLVVNASLGEHGYISGEDSASLVIVREKPVGGEVMPPDLAPLRRAIEALLLAVAAAITATVLRIRARPGPV